MLICRRTGPRTCEGRRGACAPRAQRGAVNPRSARRPFVLDSARLPTVACAARGGTTLLGPETPNGQARPRSSVSTTSAGSSIRISRRRRSTSWARRSGRGCARPGARRPSGGTRASPVSGSATRDGVRPHLHRDRRARPRSCRPRSPTSRRTPRRGRDLHDHRPHNPPGTTASRSAPARRRTTARRSRRSAGSPSPARSRAGRAP